MGLKSEHPHLVRFLVGVSIFITPLVVAVLSLSIADVNYITSRGTDTVLISLSAATFAMLVVFYTLLQMDKERSNEFMAMCTIVVGILFLMGMITGVIILINDSYHTLMELMIFFNVGSILSTVFVIIYYLLIFKVWHSEKWKA